MLLLCNALACCCAKQNDVVSCQDCKAAVRMDPARLVMAVWLICGSLPSCKMLSHGLLVCYRP